MRYIDQQLVARSMPGDWKQQAQEAADDVAGAKPQDRSAAVNRHSDVWRALKATLKDASHNKCWYCESVDTRSDNAVDHFRPKNAVAECHEHEGYWWLAFKWENYRFCCTFCNSRRVDQNTAQAGGKADHFPIRDETCRAKTPTCNLNDEEPLLLDPTNPADPGLLWFEETGQSAPHSILCNNTDGYPHKRATSSIDLYHLNHTGVVERRKALCCEIRLRVQQADHYFRKYDAGDGTARQAFDDAIRDLRGRLAADADYSATARAMLMGLRGTHPIVDVVLQAA